jgi:type I restriction enzyme M protein
VTSIQNKYGRLENLHNESDVEQNLLVHLLNDLGFTEEYRQTKATTCTEKIDKGKKRREYVPDYVAYLDKGQKKPVLIIDAKSPNVSVEQGVEDAQLYALAIRKKLDEPKPEQLCIGSNGAKTVVKKFDSDVALLDLGFGDFQDGNPRFEEFKKIVGRSAIQNRMKTNRPLKEPFEFDKPNISDLSAIFEACHNLIWRREKIPPAEAFYEFAKLMFVKLRMDREVHKQLKAGVPRSEADFRFTVKWIESLESADTNPINTVLFNNIRDELEDEIDAGTKKRMFDKDENIELGASTIKEVVRLLEHRDLYAIDEDLNGRMFETFLTAVIRGRALGQFFTPRTVVKFMVDVAGLSIVKKKIPRVLDACCGTGGFLIEAMARLTDSITSNASLTKTEKEELLEILKKESLWGVDANETIARIARINMYLHQDGGSRIYKADTLDKALLQEANLKGEAKHDLDELREAIISKSQKFDVVLTNPPFAMRYEAKKADEKKILQQYDLAKKKGTGKIASSLRSSIMFIERYHDLLNPSGLFLTIIDDSILNTTTTKFVRDWIKTRFTIRGVISLPKNCFVVSGSSSKTSILMLEKKAQQSNEQPESIFMAKSKNIGHSDSGKPETTSNDLPSILAEWSRFNSTGTPPTDDNCFVVPSSKLEDRLDVQWYDPVYSKVYEKLRSVPHTKIGDLKPVLRYGASIDADYQSDIPFLRIENLRRNDIDLSDLQFVPSALHSKKLKNLYLKDGDILIARSGTYVGLSACVGRGFDKFVYGSYIIRLRLKNEDVFTPNFLTIYLNSRFGQMQFDRQKTGSLQFNINQEQIKDIIIPLLDKTEQEIVVRDFDKKHSALRETQRNLIQSKEQLSEELADSIASKSGIKGKLVLRDFTGN